MKTLTKEEVFSWCQQRSIRVTNHGYLYFDVEIPHCLLISLEDKPSRVIALSDYLVPTWNDVPFEGALLWIRERGIWGDYSENVGAKIIQQMRLGQGETEPLEKRPGHLFGPKEIFEMHSYFLIPMIFGWDAFLIPEGKDYFLFASHDGVLGVVSQTQRVSEEVYRRVIDWNPREERDWYLKGIGTPA
jgi:hypothetical protein